LFVPTMYTLLEEGLPGLRRAKRPAIAVEQPAGSR
jgi:hypothetical protein